MTTIQQSQQKPQEYGTLFSIPKPYDQILAQVVSLPPKYLELLKRIFIGRKRFRKVFYSLTTVGDSIGYERSWVGRMAQDLHRMGILKIHGRYMNTHMWDLGDALKSGIVYGNLHDFFMGFGVKDLLSKLPVVRKNPLLILNKKTTIKKDEQARGSSPRCEQESTKKSIFVEYLERWDYSRWINLQNINGQLNNPMDEALAMEIFG